MAKITRATLKGIVKECLVELLAEGLDSSPERTQISESKRKEKRKQALLKEEARLAANRKKLENRVTDTVATVTDDPIMQSILSHTATTTLQEQLNNEPASNAGNMNFSDISSDAAGINLDSIFSSPQENWSALAFADKKTGQ
tara:strand:- start:5592 stop:6020 length:429 start_codon:yes stop_codon:yes gene_type:complete